MPLPTESQQERELRLAKKRRYYEIHKEEINAKYRKWRQENLEFAKESVRRSTKKHGPYKYPGKRYQSREVAVAKWKKAHPDACRAYRHKRRTASIGNGGSFTEHEWQELLTRYVNTCLCCHQDDVPLTADHVIPVSKGGTSNINNIQPLCRSCNSKKGTNTTDYRIEYENYTAPGPAATNPVQASLF